MTFQPYIFNWLVGNWWMSTVKVLGDNSGSTIKSTQRFLPQLVGLMNFNQTLHHQIIKSMLSSTRFQWDYKAIWSQILGHINLGYSSVSKFFCQRFLVHVYRMRCLLGKFRSNWTSRKWYIRQNWWKISLKYVTICLNIDIFRDAHKPSHFANGEGKIHLAKVNTSANLAMVNFGQIHIVFVQLFSYNSKRRFLLAPTALERRTLTLTLISK